MRSSFGCSPSPLSWLSVDCNTDCGELLRLSPSPSDGHTARNHSLGRRHWPCQDAFSAYHSRNGISVCVLLAWVAAPYTACVQQVRQLGPIHPCRRALQQNEPRATSCSIRSWLHLQALGLDGGPQIVKERSAIFALAVGIEVIPNMWKLHHHGLSGGPPYIPGTPNFMSGCPFFKLFTHLIAHNNPLSNTQNQNNNYAADNNQKIKPALIHTNFAAVATQNATPLKTMTIMPRPIIASAIG